jgi:hypothetical protein
MGMKGLPSGPRRLGCAEVAQADFVGFAKGVLKVTTIGNDLFVFIDLIAGSGAGIFGVESEDDFLR